MPKGVYPKLSRKYRRPAKREMPIEFSDDYRKLVEQILRDKRKRDMLEAYRNGAVLVLQRHDGREATR